MNKLTKLILTSFIVISLIFVGVMSYKIYGLFDYNTEEIAELYIKVARFIEKQTILNNVLLDLVRKPDLFRLRLATAEIKVGKAGGTGTIINVDEEYLYILSCRHVLNCKGKISVKVTDMTEGKGIKIENISRDNVYTDKKIDIGLIKVKKPIGKKFTFIFLSNNMPLIGTKVYGIGHPFKFHYTLTEGIVINYIDRIFDNKENEYMMISAPLYPGNSGGALINKYTEIVGVAVGVIYTNEKGVFSKKLTTHSQLSIAVKLDDIYKFLQYVIEQEKVKK